MGTKDLSIKELQAELERLGRVPAPPPRRQFVEELLTRIRVSADEQLEVVEPEPVSLADRRSMARLRVLGALAVAAALLVVVGLYSQLQGSEDGAEVLMTATEGEEVRVRPDGSIDHADGPLRAICDGPGRFELPTKTVTCEDGDEITLTVRGGKVTDVVDGTLAAVPEVVDSAMSATTVPGSTATPVPPSGAAPSPATSPGSSGSGGAPTPSSPASVTSVPSQGPGPSGQPSATVPPATVPAATAPTDIQPSTATPPSPAPTFQLQHAVASGELIVSWPAWSGPFGRYVVLRTISGKGSDREPDTPTTDGVGTDAQAASIERADQTSFAQPLDGTAGIPPDTRYVAYRVAVYDPQGRLVGLSQTLVLRLKWRTLGGSGQIDPAPVTTVLATSEPAKSTRS